MIWNYYSDLQGTKRCIPLSAVHAHGPCWPTRTGVSEWLSRASMGQCSLNTGPCSLNTVALTRVTRKSVALLTAAASFSNEPEVLAPLSYVSCNIEASRDYFLAARVLCYA